MKMHQAKPAVPGVHHLSLTKAFFLAVAMGSIGACGYLKPIDGKPDSHGPVPQKACQASAYHDFDDILVPKDMRINRKLTRIQKNQTMTAGVISFTGNLERKELVRYFKASMPKDNWERVNQLTGPRSLLQFKKQNRWCVMTITDAQNGPGSLLEIWVIPKMGTNSSGLLK